MPKTAPSVKATKSSGRLVKLSCNCRRILIPCPGTFRDVVYAATKHFPNILRENLILKTKDLEICEGESIEISEDSWDLVKAEVKTIEVVNQVKPLSPEVTTLPPGRSNLQWRSKSPCTSSTPTLPSTPIFSLPPSSRSDPPRATQASITITVKWMGSMGSTQLDSLEIRAKPSSSIQRISDAIRMKTGSEDFRLVHEGRRVSPHETLQGSGIRDGDVLWLMMEQKGGKPVIYLQAPQELRVSVRLSLVPSWEFSAIYPIVPIRSNGEKGQGQTLEWDVSTRKEDDVLLDHRSGTEVSYLYWEAKTNGASSSLASPPRPNVSQTPFDPISADLTDQDSVLLCVEKNLVVYLDKSLLALGLHVEARTSFITYWLPSFLKHEYIALRFVNQASYEYAAPLVVTPKPAVVTRIFMLFKGVSENDVGRWSFALKRTDEDVERWQDVVGMDLARAKDENLFRVLEWGGMEVLQR
ncbi:hypothetical protein VKT23_016743 [Stygiomarasmius scandens]|uniref:Ubiquitin-like domain-containing protein n=1 Tax=Marasmiellus scandens TaxID=2682957 RepID=A0ABR1ITS3_9AGAR